MDRSRYGEMHVLKQRGASVMDHSLALIWKCSAYLCCSSPRIATAGLWTQDSNIERKRKRLWRFTVAQHHNLWRCLQLHCWRTTWESRVACRKMKFLCFYMYGYLVLTTYSHMHRFIVLSGKMAMNDIGKDVKRRFRCLFEDTVPRTASWNRGKSRKIPSQNKRLRDRESNPISLEYRAEVLTTEPWFSVE